MVSVKVRWVEYFERFNININKEIRWSVHGPVLELKHGVYAIRYAAMEEIRQIDQWFKMNKAHNFEEWEEAIKLRYIPSLNCMYADKDGNIFYIYNAKLPIRNNKYNWKGVVPGDTSATLWTDFIEYHDLPKVLNPSSGYIQNCNNSPYYTLNHSIEKDSSLYSGIESTNTNRSIRAEQLFSTNTSITYEDFKKIKFDLKYSKKSNIAHIVRRALELIKNKDDLRIKKAAEVLGNWDLSTDMDNLNVALPIISFGKFIDTPVQNITDEMIIDNLDIGINFLYKHHKKLDISWGDINKLIRGDLILPLSGGPDILRAIYEVRTKNGLLKSVAGDAYMALIQWDKDGNMKSETIHQFGSASIDKNSEHYSDQAHLFSNEEFKETSLDVNTIIKDAKSIRIIY